MMRTSRRSRAKAIRKQKCALSHEQFARVDFDSSNSG